MAQISKGDTFTNGEQVTGSRLNQLVDASTLLVGAITDQPNLTANTLQSTDSTIVNDAGVLKEATIGDFLNSNLPITTSSITGGAGVDIVVAPAAGQKFDVNGAFEATTSNTTGNSTIGGNQTITGDLTVVGSFGGNINTAGNITCSGTANFTGDLQYKGTSTLQLYDVVIESYSPTAFGWGVATAFSGQWYLTTGHDVWVETIVVPTGERWIVEYNSNAHCNSSNPFNLVWMLNGTSIPFYVGYVSGTNPVIFTGGANPTRYIPIPNSAKMVLSAGTHTIKNKGAGYGGGGGIDFSWMENTKRIFKYKTA